jgi:hypothetical protein
MLLNLIGITFFTLALYKIYKRFATYPIYIKLIVIFLVLLGLYSLFLQNLIVYSIIILLLFLLIYKSTNVFTNKQTKQQNGGESNSNTIKLHERLNNILVETT